MPGTRFTYAVGQLVLYSKTPGLVDPAGAVLSIDVHEAYFHCGKALMRSRLWSKDIQVEREVFPSIGQVIHDQTKLGEPETQADVEARYKTQL